MSFNLAQAALAYAQANGGHAAMAGTIGVSTINLADYTSGRRRCTPGIAAGMAPLLGVNVAVMMAQDPDIQLALRRGALPTA